MKENSNKAIAINSLILYAKLIINTITSLLTTRFALMALGVTDFGLFSIVGSIITFISIFNTIMVATSNRFISVALGKGDTSAVNEQFNINLLIHIGIAFTTLLFAIPLGDWYIYSYLNFDGDISNAVSVYNLCVIGAIISFVGIPYNGLLMAKEQFIVFSSVDALVHILKLVVAISLLYIDQHRLLIFAFSQSVLTAVPTLIYYFVCRLYYSELVDWNIVKNKTKYKEVLTFSGWVAFGAFATVGKNQSSAVLVNLFFNTAMNAALGIANTVNGLVTTFSNAVSQPIAPQITKNYASGNIERCNNLLVLSTKITYLVMLAISLPFLVGIEWIYTKWLGNIPAFSISFTHLIIIDTLITSLNSGISNIIFASGRIKLYQIVINSLRLMAIIGAYFVLKQGVPAPALLYSYIVFSVLIFFSTQWVLKKTLNFDNTILWKKSYIPSILITIMLIPLFFISTEINAVVRIVLAEIYFVILAYWIAMSKCERNSLRLFISKKILKK